ncbi:1,4-alpha-glucan branching protein [Kitasatospora sp. NPDC002227]|uniref:maltokinase N-terminal cap-like domain-containing protein n=1 Tax=Kitasatospora sp. NPDC002227 TaxID=3154773 RepID=UPI00331FF2D3
MAAIHQTTMTPTKLELITAWLPRQDWYQGHPGEPELAKAGGFRLDDPAGEVGIEIMVVVDTAAAEPVAYLVPLGYRGEPIEGAAPEALLGTSEHGTLGTRWIYDGAHDPVVQAQLLALLHGEAIPQHQDESDTPDLTVTVQGTPTTPTVHLNRTLRPTTPAAATLHANWTWPGGTPAHGTFATAD